MNFNKKIKQLFKDERSKKVSIVLIIIYLLISALGTYLCIFKQPISLLVVMLFYFFVFGIAGIILVYQLSRQVWKQSVLEFYEKYKEEMQEKKMTSSPKIRLYIQEIEDIYQDEMFRKETVSL